MQRYNAINMRKSQAYKLSFTLVFLLMEAAVLSLGYWQYGRMHEKRDARTEIEAQLAESQTVQLSQAQPWQRVDIIGTLDNSRSIALAHQQMGALMGWRIVTPMALDDWREVLIDRGWMRFPENRIAPNFEQFVVTEPINISGVVRPFPSLYGRGTATGASDRVLNGFNPDLIDKTNPRLPFYIQATTPTHADLLARLSPLPDGARHQQYMLTWWGMALVLLFGFVGWIRQIFKKK